MPYPESTYNDFKAGRANGGAYQDFLASIPTFFTANTYDQYLQFLYWWQSGTKAAIALGLWDWLGWSWARMGLSPARVSDPLQGAELNQLPVIGRAPTLAAYNAERSRMGLTTSTTPVTTAPIPGTAPKPVYPVVAPVTRKAILYDFVLKDGPGPLWQEKAETMTDTMTDGSVRTYPWVANSQWTTPDKLKAQYAGSSIPVTVRVRYWSDVPAGEQAQIEAAAPSTYTNPTPIPPPPPGSTLYVPAPGSGLEPTLTVAGSTTPVPVSQVPPTVWQWQAAPENANQMPGAIVGAGAGSVTASTAGVGSALAIAALVGLVMFSKRKKAR
jgi:hypothetical protein